MKTLFDRLASRLALGSSGPVTAALLLLATHPAAAATSTSYTATGWVIGVPVPGIWFTNALGQVGIRGNAHLARVESTDARLTGRRTIFVDGAAQADRSALLYGPAYHEVGSWDLADPQNPKFTPTGGMWETTYRGTMGADGNLQLHIVGAGWGGTIDGLRLDETLTRDAGAILDPAIPYNYTGTIKPPPLRTSEVLDDFSGPAVGWTYYGPAGSYSYTRPDGQLLVMGHWPGVITRNVPDTYTLGAPPSRWTVADGQTVEARVELVNLNESATAARLALGDEAGFYSVFKGHDFLALSKWSANLPWGSVKPVILFFYEQAQVPDANVLLSLALTRANPNVVVTARVLDKGNPNSVLYERSVVDAPTADPALTAAELLSLSGMNLALSPDLTGAPFTAGGVPVGVWQYNADGQQPAAEATYDNLELRKYEVPPLGIARAVRLSWLAPAGVNFAIEGAPTVQGPWLPIQELPMPGLQQMSVPASEVTEFFRLRQAP